MSEAPPSTARRTRRARRMSIESFDALRGNGASRATLPPDAVQAPDVNPDADLPPTEAQADTNVPSTGTLRTDAATSGDLEIPYEAQFAGKDFLAGPGLRRVAQSLIMRDNRLRHLTNVHVEYLWKRRGGSTKGAAKIGECVMPGGLSRHAWNAMAQARSGSPLEAVIFVVWLAADHLETYTALQVEAALYRQLLKTATDPRDHSAFKLRAPDFVGFVAEIERYGLWNQSLVEAAPAFRGAPTQQTQQVQPGLFQTNGEQAAADPFSSPVEEETGAEPDATNATISDTNQDF